MNFFSLLHSSLVKFADQEAITWPQSDGTTLSVTYQVLQQRIELARHQLRKHGVDKGGYCLLLLPASLDAIVVLLAVMSEGAIPMIPPPGMSRTQWQRIHKKHSIKFTVVGPPTPRKVRWFARVLPGKVIVYRPGKATTKNMEAPVEVADDQPGLISHSSGSTGEPKAIFRNHGVLVQQHKAIDAIFPAWEGQIDFPLFPNVLLHNLAVGTHTIMPNIPGFSLENLDVRIIAEQLKRHEIQTLTGNVFYFWHLLIFAESRGMAFPSAQAVGIGGSPVPDKLMGRLQAIFPKAKVYGIYGSSEAEPIAIRRYETPDIAIFGYQVGRIVEGLSVKFLDAQIVNRGDEEVVAGEICVQGSHVAVESGKWLHTGDFGYLHKDVLYLTGRKGNEKVVDGIMHYQLEHALWGLVGIERLAVIEENKTFNIAYVGKVSPTQVREEAHKYIHSKYLHEVYPVSMMPVDSRHRSKILYRKLKK